MNLKNLFKSKKKKRDQEMLSKAVFGQALKMEEERLSLEKENPTFRDLFKKSDRLTSEGKYKDALKYINKALKINPKHLTASNLKIGLLKELGKDKEASKYIKEDFIIRMNLTEKNASFWSMKGSIYMIDKKYEKAIKCFEKALKIDPNLIGCEREKEKAVKLLNKD